MAQRIEKPSVADGVHDGDVICQFCWRGKEVEDIAGTLHATASKKHVIAAHHKCMQYASGLIQYKHSVFGGFNISDVEKEISRGSKLRCAICRKQEKGRKPTGAACGCAVKTCRKTFHFTCAYQNETAITKRLVVTKNKKNKKYVLYRVFCCPEHESAFRDDLKQELRQKKKWGDDDDSDDDTSSQNDSMCEASQPVVNGSGSSVKDTSSYESSYIDFDSSMVTANDAILEGLKVGSTDIDTSHDHDSADVKNVSAANGVPKEDDDLVEKSGEHQGLAGENLHQEGADVPHANGNGNYAVVPVGNGVQEYAIVPLVSGVQEDADVLTGSHIQDGDLGNIGQDAVIEDSDIPAQNGVYDAVDEADSDFTFPSPVTRSATHETSNRDRRKSGAFSSNRRRRSRRNVQPPQCSPIAEEQSDQNQSGDSTLPKAGSTDTHDTTAQQDLPIVVLENLDNILLVTADVHDFPQGESAVKLEPVTSTVNGVVVSTDSLLTATSDHSLGDPASSTGASGHNSDPVGSTTTSPAKGSPAGRSPQEVAQQSSSSRNSQQTKDDLENQGTSQQPLTPTRTSGRRLRLRSPDFAPRAKSGEQGPRLRSPVTESQEVVERSPRIRSPMKDSHEAGGGSPRIRSPKKDAQETRECSPRIRLAAKDSQQAGKSLVNLTPFQSVSSASPNKDTQEHRSRKDASDGISENRLDRRPSPSKTATSPSKISMRLTIDGEKTTLRVDHDDMEVGGEEWHDASASPAHIAKASDSQEFYTPTSHNRSLDSTSSPPKKRRGRPPKRKQSSVPGAPAETTGSVNSLSPKPSSTRVSGGQFRTERVMSPHKLPSSPASSVAPVVELEELTSLTQNSDRDETITNSRRKRKLRQMTLSDVGRSSEVQEKIPRRTDEESEDSSLACAVLVVPADMSHSEADGARQCAASSMGVQPQQIWTWQQPPGVAIQSDVFVFFVMDTVKAIENGDSTSLRALLFEREQLAKRVEVYTQRHTQQAQMVRDFGDAEAAQEMQSAMWSCIRRKIKAMAVSPAFRWQAAHLIRVENQVVLGLDLRVAQTQHVRAGIRARKGLYRWTESTTVNAFPRLSLESRQKATELEFLTLLIWLREVCQVKEVLMFPQDSHLLDTTVPDTTSSLTALVETLREKVTPGAEEEGSVQEMRTRRMANKKTSKAGGDPPALLVFLPADFEVVNFQQYFVKVIREMLHTKPAKDLLALVPTTNLHHETKVAISALVSGVDGIEQGLSVDILSAFCPDDEPVSQVVLRISAHQEPVSAEVVTRSPALQLSESDEREPDSKTSGNEQTVRKRRGGRPPKKSLEKSLSQPPETSPEKSPLRSQLQKKKPVEQPSENAEEMEEMVLE